MTTGSGGLGVTLADLTWEEAADALRAYPVAALPLGAGAKEHGPHLPLGTDFIWAETLAKAAAERARCVVLPTLSFAYYPAFVDWPGSISLRPETFMAVVRDTILSIARHGMRRFFVINTGVSTTAPLEIVSRELHESHGLLVAVMLIETVGDTFWKTVAQERAGTHAGEKETSFLLHVRPDLVRANRIADEIDDRGGAAFQTGVPGPRKVILGRKMGTKSGIHGQATLATAEKGAGLLRAQTDEMVALIDALAAAPLPADSGSR